MPELTVASDGATQASRGAGAGPDARRAIQFRKLEDGHLFMAARLTEGFAA